MNRGLASAAATALATSALVALGDGGAQAAAEPNLIQNPGFEAGLNNWTCSGGSGSSAASPVHGGASSLRATPASADNAKCSQTVSVQPNSAYELSGWVQGGYVYLGASGTGTTDVSTWSQAASDWKQLSTKFTTGPNTTSVTFYRHGWYGQPAYHADDLTLTGPPGQELQAAPAGLAAPTSSSVTLSWNPTKGATGYHVYQDGKRVQAVSGTSATVTGLAPATSYKLQVTATNTAGESPKSAEITATTTAGGGDRKSVV